MLPVHKKFHSMNTRNEEKYKVHFANTGRLQKASIIYIQKLLNENEKIQNQSQLNQVTTIGSEFLYL